MAVEPMNLDKTGAGRTVRMHSTGRQRRIRELFASEPFIDLENLCRKLTVSDSTIRHDLIEFESKGFVRHVYGGAMSMETRNEVLDWSRQTIICHGDKKGTGKAAAALLYPVSWEPKRKSLMKRSEQRCDLSP